MPKKIAIFPASFDPVTNGHADLIDRICNLGVFDELIVAIGVNPAKPARFTLEERTEMLEAVIQPYPQATIDGYTGLTVHYAQTRGACAIIRGLREISDFEWEFKMARMNQQIAPDIDTLFHDGEHAVRAYQFNARDGGRPDGTAKVKRGKSYGRWYQQLWSNLSRRNLMSCK